MWRPHSRSVLQLLSDKCFVCSGFDVLGSLVLDLLYCNVVYMCTELKSSEIVTPRYF